MADLKQSEKLILEKQFSMGGGYVLGFSNNKLSQFIFDIFKIDIYNDKYAKYGDSKANRIRAFWDIEGNVTVAKLITELLDTWKTERLINNRPIEKNETELYNQCKTIANRLLGNKVPTPNQTENSIDDFL